MSPIGVGAISATNAAGSHRLSTDAPAPAPSQPTTFNPALIEQQVESVAREVEALRGELDAMRRRDEALNTYLRKMDEELRLAARLQQDFLPKSMPQIGRVRFHTLFRPAGYVSGDM
jgi:phosphoserine phosphatase RsbU/P